MSKMLKNAIAIFAAVCVIVLVIFCIELYVLNREPDDGGGTGSSLAGNVGDGDEKGKDGAKDTQETQPANGMTRPGDDNDKQTSQQPPATPTSPPTGKQHTRRVSGDEQLLLYVDEDLFEYTELNDGYLYEYTGGGEATLEISFALISNGLEALAKDFLDGFVGTGGTKVEGEGQIGRSLLRGVHVTGDVSGENYEAWIYSFPDGEDLGLSFTLHYRSDEQKNALYAIFDHMSIVPA